MSTSIRVDQRSYRRVMENLSLLPRRVGIRVYRIALNAWGGVVKQVAVSRARRRTGLLKKSQVVKVKIPDASYNVKHHGKPAYVMVGTSRDAVAPFAGNKKLSVRKATKRVLSGGKVRAVRPSRYAHLVEARFPFIEPASRAGEGPGFLKFEQKMAQGIAAEAAKLPK